MSGNNWRNKREEQHQAHNRKPGAALYWKQLRNRRGRRFSNRFNEWRVTGKIPVYSDKDERPIKFRESNKPLTEQVTYHKLVDFLSKEEIEALNKFHD